MSHCTIEGCPNAAVAKGLCAKHYMRVVRTGDATAKQKPGPKPKPGGKGEAMASLQAEIAALKTRLAAEVERPRAERHRVTKPVTKPGTADAAPLLTRIETLEAELVRERLEHSATRSLYRRALEAHAGLLTRAEWGQICHCLAPEHAPAELQKQFGEAYRLFIACENLFIKKGERAVAINEKPITRLDLDALKRRTTEERRQKRAKSAKAKPRPR